MKWLVIILAILIAPSVAFAKHSHKHHSKHYYEQHHVIKYHGKHYKHYRQNHSPVAVESSSTLLEHPSGCPSTAFCGCGASIEVFGHSVRDLWLAANWFKFPSTSAAPGMVAVRQHHVMVIRSVVGPGTAVVYDANSGHHRTQVHTVSLAGYSIRNPHGG